MEKTKIKLTDIPRCLLRTITTTKLARVYLNGLEVKEIFIHRNDHFRINTIKGQYRKELDTDVEIEIITN